MTTRAIADVWHLREDRGTILRASARPDGARLVSGIVARPGIYEYRDAAGRITRELVPEQTLADSIATLGRAPVTLQHPAEDVTPENAGALVVGDVDGTVEMMADGYVVAKLAVRRKDAIDAIDSGRTVELSPGYRVRLGPPGVDPVHGPYDAVQLERTVNHLALVDRARGGPEVRLRTDAAESTTLLTAAPPHHEVPAMKPHWLPLLLAAGITLRADATDETAAEALRAHLDRQAEKQRADSATHTTALAAATARADAAEARVKALEAAEATRADAADRLALEPVAVGLGIDPKASADTKALRRAVAAKKLGADLRADATDAYVDALVDLARADHGKERHRADPAGVQAGAAAWRPGQAARADAADPGQRPTRRPTANEQHAKRVAEARKAQGLG